MSKILIFPIILLGILVLIPDAMAQPTPTPAPPITPTPTPQMSESQCQTIEGLGMNDKQLQALGLDTQCSGNIGIDSNDFDHLGGSSQDEQGNIGISPNDFDQTITQLDNENEQTIEGITEPESDQHQENTQEVEQMPEHKESEPMQDHEGDGESNE